MCMYDNVCLNVSVCLISLCVCAAAERSVCVCACVGGCVCVCGKFLPGTKSHYEHKQPVEAGVKDVFIQKILLLLSSSLP